VCGDPETIHGVVTDKVDADSDGPTSQQSFHPKISGTQRYAQAFEDTLAQIM
jgi:hypothetical protein